MHKVTFIELFQPVTSDGTVNHTHPEFYEPRAQAERAAVCTRI